MGGNEAKRIFLPCLGQGFLKIGLVQLCSVFDFKTNLKKISSLIQVAKDQGAEMIFLPECFYSMGDGVKATEYLVEKDGEHYENIRSLALKYKVYLLGGSAATRHGIHVINRCYNFDPHGNDLGVYDKINLFSSEFETGKKIDEGLLYTAGKTPTLIEALGWKIGLSLCFDLRFPSLFESYRGKAHIISASSAFTPVTGKAHFHVLLRARAIENQCFVIAAAQWGQHHPSVRTYGHSLAIDPWGDILVDGGEGEKVLVVDLHIKKIEETRRKIKMRNLENRHDTP